MRTVSDEISRTSFVAPAFSRTIRTTGVIARLDRAIQYSETVVVEPRGRGVLDAPPSRGMTAEYLELLPATSGLGFVATATPNPATIASKKVKRSPP